MEKKSKHYVHTEDGIVFHDCKKCNILYNKYMIVDGECKQCRIRENRDKI